MDTLTAIRKLKEYGVEVYFEEQNIYTLDGKGEVLLTIMSSIAQEESRNISENVTWGMRKRFADGKVTMPYGQFMGYRRGKDGTPEVVEAEAEIVRTIFRRFLEGATPAMISRELNLAGVPCPSRKSLLSENEAEIAKARKKTSRWGTSTVENILVNEKYKGDAILQKTYCTAYLLKTFVVNDGSVVPKYDRILYKRRNEVERFFRRIKRFRRVFTRYDKLDIVFAGFILFAMIFDSLV